VKATLIQGFKDRSEITLADRGQTVTLPVSSRFFVFLDDDRYPLSDLIVEPVGMLLYISNGSFSGPSRYPIYFEPLGTGECTLRNGDFSVDILFVQPTSQSPTLTPLPTYAQSYP
jgi:hypothetical protein